MTEKCFLCPRCCGVHRDTQRGFCGETTEPRIARASLHMWEEPCISGENGSGTVFFSGCSLRCVFCQNKALSHSEKGVPVSTDRLVHIFFRLADKGAHNINLVTPTHFTPEIAKAIKMAKNRGFSLPFVWNSGGYENAEALRTLEGLVDVYLPDMKYMSKRLSAEYSGAADYPERAATAISEMKRQQPCDVFENGLIKKGVIIRHLVLPGCVENSLDVLDFIKKAFGKGQLISVMSQYTPIGDRLPDELNRTVSADEYERVTSYAMMIGLTNGWFQDGDSIGESFIPDFDCNDICAP